MFVTDFIEQEKATLTAEISELEQQYGADAMKGFAAVRWGLSSADAENLIMGNVALLTNFQAAVQAAPDILENLLAFADKKENELGKGFVRNIFCAKYDLVLGNPAFQQGGSFDGTDKGGQSGSPEIFYHLENMCSQTAADIRQQVMDAASPEALTFFDDLDYDPVRVQDASELSEDFWHEMRQYSIGASAIAGISGSSPFQNRLSIWNEKLGHEVLVEEKDEDKKFKERIFAWGHQSESYIRILVSQMDMFAGCEVIVEPMIFSLENHPWLTCNLDAMLRWPDGHYSILEFKAPSPHAKENYDNNAVPVYYEEQMQMQMAEVNVDDAYLVALFNRDEYTVSHVVRDLDYEMDLMKQAKDFWLTNVVGEQEPEVNGPGSVTKDTLRRYGGKGNKRAPALQLDAVEFASILRQADEIGIRRAALDKESRQLKSEQETVMAPVFARMGVAEYATCDDASSGIQYSVKYNEVEDSAKVNATTMKRMKSESPDLYQELSSRGYITMSGGGRRSSVSGKAIIPNP